MLRAGRPGFDSQQGQGVLFVTASRLSLRTSLPPIQWGVPVSYPMGTRGSFLGGKAAGA